MSKGSNGHKRRRRRRTVGSKIMVLILSGALLIGSMIGGTLAWLTAKTNEVSNVFTTSDISITLQEHTYNADEDKLTSTETIVGVNNYKMIPGWTIPKDPWLTVKANSEDCYLFIKVEEKGGSVTVEGKNCTFDDFIDYAIDPNNWEPLTDTDGNVVDDVYIYKSIYRTTDKDSDIKILGYYNGDKTGMNFVPNTVLVKDTVTKEMMNVLKNSGESNLPTLTFTAYASQYWKNNDTPFKPYEAWNNVNPSTP